MMNVLWRQCARRGYGQGICGSDRRCDGECGGDRSVCRHRFIAPSEPAPLETGSCKGREGLCCHRL